MSGPVRPPETPLKAYATGMAGRMGLAQPEAEAPPPTPPEEPQAPAEEPQAEPESTEPEQPLEEAAEEPSEEPEPEAEASEPEATEEVAEPEAEEEEPRKYPVRINGEDHEVDLPELIAGYQRFGDYTQKTMALASERKEHEHQVSKFAEMQEKAAQQWQQAGEYLVAEVRGLSEQDWTTLQREDPEQFREIQGAIQARQQLAQQILERAAREKQEAIQRRLPAEKAKLIERLNASRIPIDGKEGDWSDPEQFQRGYKGLSEWAIGSAGIPMERWNETIDSLEIWIVASAMARELEAKSRSVIQKKVKEKVRKVAKPAPPPAAAPSAQAASQNRIESLRQNPSMRNRRDVLKEVLRERGAFAKPEVPRG